MKEIILAGGCFWGVEEYFRRTPGVLETEVAYANGHTENPTYQEVCSHHTGYAEACRVRYDENIISLEGLLTLFWDIIDPTAWNRQGPDVGSQYRSGIYYTDPADFATITASIIEEQKKYQEPIRTEVEPLKNYYPAEEYHQKYLVKNPRGYCHIPLPPLE